MPGDVVMNIDLARALIGLAALCGAVFLYYTIPGDDDSDDPNDYRM